LAKRPRNDRGGGAALDGTAPCWMGATTEKAANEIAALADKLKL
jgi:hypothetical protein